MGHFGLDIGSYNIKVAAVDGYGDHSKIKKVASVPNPVGVILPTNANQQNQLATTIKQTLKDMGLLGQECHLSLSGSSSYISVISMPVLTNNELSSAISWEAEQHIPVSLSEVNYEYDVLSRPDKNSGDDNMQVLLVGAPKTVVSGYLNLMEMVGVESIGMEPEVLSLVRAFIPEKGVETEATTLYCCFGALTSDLVVVDKGNISVVHSAEIGSLALTRALERGLSLQPSQAEEYKRSYGAQAELLEGKVNNVLLPVLETFVREVKKTMQFFVSKSPATNRISRVVVTGGGANLPGISTYLAQQLSVEVLVGDPFKRFSSDKKLQMPPDKTSLSIAIGLAVKEF